VAGFMVGNEMKSNNGHLPRRQVVGKGSIAYIFREWERRGGRDLDKTWETERKFLREKKASPHNWQGKNCIGGRSMEGTGKQKFRGQSFQQSG